jgi:hypothetical protein
MTCDICQTTCPDNEAYNPDPDAAGGPVGHRACVDPLPEHNHAEPVSPDWRHRAGVTA